MGLGTGIETARQNIKFLFYPALKLFFREIKLYLVSTSFYKCSYVANTQRNYLEYREPIREFWPIAKVDRVRVDLHRRHWKSLTDSSL